MVKSSIFEHFTSPAKGQPKKKAVMKRYGRRQLLKEKAGKAFIQKNPNGAESERKPKLGKKRKRK